MSATLKKTPKLTRLKRAWIDWHRCVEHVFYGRKASLRYSSRNYGMLHRDLLAACRDCRQEAIEANRQFAQRLSVLASAWISAESLQHADRRIVKDLLVSCDDIDHELRHYRLPRRWLPKLALTLAALVCLGMFVFAGISPQDTAETGWESLQQVATHFWLICQGSKPVRILSIVTLVVVVLGVWFLRFPNT